MGLFGGRRRTDPHWIRHSRLFGPDEYECSECGAVSRRRLPACPGCGAVLTWVLDRLEWMDEEEDLHNMLDD